MKVYLDSDFICHIDNAEGRIAAESDFFDDRPRNLLRVIALSLRVIHGCVKMVKSLMA